jgi:phosphopantothenoylcysteine synthetase/decarboxylase
VDGEQKLKGCFQFQSAAGKSISVSSCVCPVSIEVTPPPPVQKINMHESMWYRERTKSNMNTLKSYGKERHELSARCDHKKCAQCAHNAAAVQASKIFMVWCFCSGLHSTLNTLLMITKHGEQKPAHTQA